MALPVNDFLQATNTIGENTIPVPAYRNNGNRRALFGRGKKTTVNEEVRELNRLVGQAELDNVRFLYGKGTVGSEGTLPTFLGVVADPQLEVHGSDILAHTTGIFTDSDTYDSFFPKKYETSGLDFAHQVTIGEQVGQSNFDALTRVTDIDLGGKNVNSALFFNVDKIFDETLARDHPINTVLHEFTHSANTVPNFTGGESVERSYEYASAAYDNLFNSYSDASGARTALEDWMPDFQKNLNLAYASHGAEEARAELGRLSFLGHPVEEISKSIDPNYVSYIGRFDGDTPGLAFSGSNYRRGYSGYYENNIRKYLPQEYKDASGIVMDESEKWIQASLREAEMNAHAAGVMTILHNSEHIPGFQQQRELMMQMFEEEQKNNPQYGRIVQNLRETMFKPGEEPAFRVDIPGAKWLEPPAKDLPGSVVQDATLEAVTPAEALVEDIGPGVTKTGDVYTFTGDLLEGDSALGASVGEVVEDTIGSGHTLSTATSTAAEVVTTTGSVSGVTSTATSVVGAVGGGAGATVTSTAATTTSAAVTTAAGSSAGTRTAAAAGKGVSEELIKGFKNVDNIRMAGVAAILGVGALAYSSNRRRN